MTSALFTEWVQEHDRKFKAYKFKILIVIDNCPTHPHIDGLRAVKMVFLPPNTTSRTQPMDQGITANLKHHFRSILVKQFISAIHKHERYVVSVLDVMRLI